MRISIYERNPYSVIPAQAGIQLKKSGRSHPPVGEQDLPQHNPVIPAQAGIQSSHFVVTGRNLSYCMKKGH